MKTIAIIEDDQPIGDLLEEALGQAGYATLRAYSGTEAQYLLERAKPDLILLDLMLPGLTGEELLPCLGEIPVIVVSAKVGGGRQGECPADRGGGLCEQAFCHAGASGPHCRPASGAPGRGGTLSRL